MSVPGPNKFITSANNNYSLYITREEVIQGISSIIPALSSFSTITFGVSPNPLFSTVTLPRTGVIQGYAPIQTSNVIFAATSPVVGAAAQLKLGTVGNQSTNALVVTDANNNTGVMRASRYIANVGGAAGYGAGWSFTNAGFTLLDANDNQISVLTAPIGNSNAIALNNISTINGAPVGAGITTYTNLTGNNLTNNQTLTAPRIVSVSSINAIPIAQYLNQAPWTTYAVTNTTTNVVNLTANIPTTGLGFSNLPIVASGTGSAGYNISVPVLVSLGGSVAQTTRIKLTAYIGGQVTGGTGVSAVGLFTPGSTQGIYMTLAGVAIVNGTQTTMTVTIESDYALTGVNIVQGSGTFNSFFFQRVF